MFSDDSVCVCVCVCVCMCVCVVDGGEVGAGEKHDRGVPYC